MLHTSIANTEARVNLLFCQEYVSHQLISSLDEHGLGTALRKVINREKSYARISTTGTSKRNGFMKLYRFSPIQDEATLLEAIKHIHFSCYALCKESFGEYLSNAGNMGVFCHYEYEYSVLVEIREALTEASDTVDQKYFRLNKPIIIPAQDDVPETTYTHLYIRKPDPYRHHVGDVDFFLGPEKYAQLKRSLLDGAKVEGARVFNRADLDMVELYSPDADALAYVSTEKMTEDVRVKINVQL